MQERIDDTVNTLSASLKVSQEQARKVLLRFLEDTRISVKTLLHAEFALTNKKRLVPLITHLIQIGKIDPQQRDRIMKQFFDELSAFMKENNAPLEKAFPVCRAAFKKRYELQNPVQNECGSSANTEARSVFQYSTGDGRRVLRSTKNLG